MKYVAATFLLCLQLAGAAEDAAAETPAVITECPASDLSASASPSKYHCTVTPSYAVGATAAGTTVAAVPDTNGEFTIALSPTLSLTTATQCGATAAAPVTCNDLYLTFGTADDQDDGSKIVLGADKYDGLAHWSCTDSASPALTFHYYFLMKVGDTANADTDATATIAELNKAVKNNDITVGSFKPNLFQKFAAVDKSTQIYFFKESSTVSHTVFSSDQTLIPFSTAQWTTLTDGATQIAKQNAAGVCNNAVLFCFEDDCEKSGAAALLSGTMMMLIPVIFTQF